MMKLQFNNKDLLLLQQQLYQQRDEILKIQATLIEQDINAWISSNFELSDSQLAFFESIDQHLKLILSMDISFTIENRLPIKLNALPEQILNGVATTQAFANYRNGVLHLHLKVNTEN